MATAYPGSQAHGVMFHHFHGGRHPKSQGSISSEDLEELLDHVGRNRILPARVWMERALTGKLKATDLCITFDDNLRCQFDIAYPVLEQAGIEAFWFVYTSVLNKELGNLEVYRHYRTICFADVDEFYSSFMAALHESPYADEAAAERQKFESLNYLREYPFYSDQDRWFRYLRDRVLGDERYGRIMDSMIEVSERKGQFSRENLFQELWMDSRCLQELHAHGHLVGLHSYSHPTQMAELKLEEQNREYRKNIDDLAKCLGQKPVAMSHPCNSYTSETLALLGDLGIRLGFRANLFDVPNRGQLEWPREDHSNIFKRMKQA